MKKFIVTTSIYKPAKLNNSILHLDHAKPHQKDYSSTMHEYVNPPHWGLLKVIIN